MTLDQVKRVAPSVMAESAADDVSSRYEFYPTIAVIETMMSQGWQVTKAVEMHVRKDNRKGYQKHLVRMSREDLVLGDDRIETVIVNSHDRSCAYQFMMGIWRLVCSNGLVVGDELFSLRVKHINISAQTVMNASDQLLEVAPNVRQEIKRFKEVPLEPVEQAIYADIAAKIIYGEDTPIDNRKLLQPRRWSDRNDDSLWRTYNTVQENAMKGGVRYTTTDTDGLLQSRSTKSIRSIDRDVKINQYLYQLTAEMAKLKGN